MKTVLVLTIVQLMFAFSSNQAQAFVIPLDTVLTKTVAQSGNQIFSVEQDVIFTVASEDFVIRETWLIEGDKNLKLLAVGQGSLKDTFRLAAVYNNKAKTTVQGKNRVAETVGPDFFERYLSIRSPDSFKKYLTDLFISPLIRLSRTAGSISFAIGEPSQPTALRPQMWIDQDQFHIRKIRLPSGAEAQFDDYVASGAVHYPRTKIIEWAEHSATIKVRNINTKVKASLSNFYPQNLDQPSEISLATKGQAGVVIQDFYKRFR